MKFQSYAYGTNHWAYEPDLPAILTTYWSDYPQHTEELDAFGRLAGGQAYALADYIDRQAPPSHLMYDLDGKRIDQVLLCPQHLGLLRELAWINRPPYEGGSWHHHYALAFLLADPGLYCSLIVTNQTAYAIYKYATDQQTWLSALLSGEMWGATWMTETQGGSDLGSNTTTAIPDGSCWRLDGENKYFASNAGLADLALVTARPQDAPAGPKGLALFLVPRLDQLGELNFILRRLKQKSATRAVPTGEVEFHNSEAFLVGDKHLGIYYTLETLTVSRLANAVGAMGLARKAHLESLWRVHQRTAFGDKLISHPLIRWDLTDLAVRTAGGLALVFHAIEHFDRAWHTQPPYTNAYHYARFLSHLAKNRTADHASETTRLAMELFGGLGFLEDYAVSRLHRESLVTSIWEGASNIQALDMLEALAKKNTFEPYMDEMDSYLHSLDNPAVRLARRVIEATYTRLASSDSAQWYAKDALTALADAATVALLFRLGETSGERYAQLAELYAQRFLAGEPYPAWAADTLQVWYPWHPEAFTT